MRTRLLGWNRRRLRLWLGLFFLSLAVPTGLLIYQAHSRLKWETFHQYQVLAVELAARIDARFGALIAAEEARSFADYSFLVVAGDPAASFLQPSPLAAYPVNAAIPGLIGYFQVDNEGRFSTPLAPPPGTAPAAYGVSDAQLGQRLALQRGIQEILARNRLVQDRATHVARQTGRGRGPDDPSASVAQPGAATTDTAAPSSSAESLSQRAFDQLNLPSASGLATREPSAPSIYGRLEDLKLDYRYQASAPPAQGSLRQAPPPAGESAKLRGARKERRASLEPARVPPKPAASAADAVEAQARAGDDPRIRIFESEIDPFELSLLDSGHFVLFRRVWRDGQRYIQGALIEPRPLLQGVIEKALRETVLAQVTDLAVAWQERVLAAFSGVPSRAYFSGATELTGAALYQTRLSAPLGQLGLLFSVSRLPAGPGGAVVAWLAAILVLVLSGGTYLLYRLGLRQIELARQQQDFVSAVSHELKTPLTSIRMYGEILREGWASEDKKHTYYTYIHEESERLSRLIANVLRFARMTRNDLRLELKPVTAGELMDGVRSKVHSQVERAGFALHLDCEGAAAAAVVYVDTDAFSQILINLVDNAVKFSAQAERRIIEMGCRLVPERRVGFSVRDYGPGVPRDQRKRIFQLFYRAENEFTRQTAGTGIGLALVRQLAEAMRGSVEVTSREPGAEFSVCFAVGTP